MQNVNCEDAFPYVRQCLHQALCIHQKRSWTDFGGRTQHTRAWNKEMKSNEVVYKNASCTKCIKRVYMERLHGWCGVATVRFSTKIKTTATLPARVFTAVGATCHTNIKLKYFWQGVDSQTTLWIHTYS